MIEPSAGDYITHQPHGSNFLYETIFMRTAGRFFVGKATQSTKQIHRKVKGTLCDDIIDDIDPADITHINRISVEAYE